MEVKLPFHFSDAFANMSYLEHFNDQARADVHLIAHITERCICGGDLTSECKSFYLQESFIVTGSKFFRTRLETALGGLDSEMSTVGRLRTITILHDYVEEAELEAVELVLKSFYALQGPLPLDLIPSAIDDRVPLLLKTLMVAERYQADSCKEKVARALSSIPSSDLSYEAVKHMLTFPTSLCTIPSFSLFCTNAFTILTNMFQDLPVIATTFSDHFMTLPHSFLLSWITRDDLKVHSENDVVYLLNIWIEHNNPSSDDAEALIREIRIVNLGPSYLHQILPRMVWFTSCHLSQHLSAVLVARDSCMLADMAKELPDFPPAWVSAPRQAAGYVPPASTAFNWILKEDQLKELYSGNKVLCRPTIYANGHWLEGFAKSFVDPGEDGLQYSLGVGIELPPAVYGCQTSLRIFITVLAGEEVSKASHCCSLILSSGHGEDFGSSASGPRYKNWLLPTWWTTKWSSTMR